MAKKRMAQYELLRIVAMLMVITLHFLDQTGGIPEAVEVEGALTSREVVGILAESFCIVSLNTYVLISGYFLPWKTYTYRRPLRLIAQILFYSLLIPPVLVLVGQLPAQTLTDPYHLWSCLFPVLSGHYWFATAYLVLLLFAPLLNAAVRTLSRAQLRAVIWGLLLFFCIGKSLSILPFATDKYGYDFGWLIVLYLIAAYLRGYGSRLLGNARRSLLVFLFSCAGIAALTYLTYAVYLRTGKLSYYSTVPFHLNFLLTLTGSLGLFCCFGRLRIPDGKISKGICQLSSATFGIYLLHQHEDLAQIWTSWLLKEPSEWPMGYLVQLAGCVFIVFLVGAVIDLLRARVFALLERMVLKTAWGGRLRALLDRLDGIWVKKEGTAQ